MKRVPQLRLARQAGPGQPPHPRFVVWELTLACDQRCVHCGSRAAEARAGELGTDEALDVVRQLAELGTGELALIGGEAYLHAGFFEVVTAARAAGMRPTMTTGGRGIGAELARRIAAAGMAAVAVSIDGLQATHDLLRATPGSFDAVIAAVGHLRAAGLEVSCNTVVNRLNFEELEPLYEILVGAGVRGWQVQLMAPLGRAADRPELMVQPWQLLTLVPRIARLKERAFRDGVLVSPGNNVGYFSRDEKLLRSLRPDGDAHWSGCSAGKYVMGIESDGAVKGCPSLPTRGYVGGNVRAEGIRRIWDEAPELAFTRRRTVEDLWGFCRTCAFGAVCLGGCNFTAHALVGRAGNNPYCHYRVKTLAAEGVRERLVLRARAPGEPFDCGKFEIVKEPFDAPEVGVEARRRGRGRGEMLRVWRG